MLMPNVLLQIFNLQDQIDILYVLLVVRRPGHPPFLKRYGGTLPFRMDM